MSENYIQLNFINKRKYLNDEIIPVANIENIDSYTAIYEENDSLIITTETNNINFYDGFDTSELYEKEIELEISDKNNTLFKNKMPKMYLMDYVENRSTRKTKLLFKPVKLK
jgi:hypothetical protein